MISCTFEDGGTGKLRHTVIDAIIVNDRDEILLEKRADFLIEGGKWALVGGFIDHNENAHDTVKREVLEETGWDVSVGELLFIKDSPHRPDNGRQNISLVFLCTPIKKIGEPDEESTDVQWFPLTALPDAKLLAFDHLEILSLFRKYRRQPFATPLFC
jgi:8-oxo-dGTP diphosphatase